MKAAAERLRGQPAVEIIAALLAEARAIHEEDRRMCRAIGRHGAALAGRRPGRAHPLQRRRPGHGRLRHGPGRDLRGGRVGQAAARLCRRNPAPCSQGARLTAWELQQRGIEVTLICDSVAAQVMREGRVQAVVTGADRIAANGDTANKIGTYGVALLAAAHRIPFYVAAPTSTFDLTLADGGRIPIEQRDPREVTHGFGRQTAPEGIDVYNPAFDVTPAELIAAIVCPLGVIRPVNRQRIAEVVGKGENTEKSEPRG